MDETEMLKKIVKKKRRNSITIRYRMFGLSLGQEHYERLDKYCTKHSIYKSTLVRNLVIEYLDKVEQKDN